MYKLLLTMFFILLGSPVFAQEFSIDKVFVESEYNSRYVLTYSNRLIPIGERITSKTVDCLVENLNESQMFQKIETELIPTGKNEEYSLIIKPIYKGNPKEYRIQEIVIKDSLDVNKESLLDQFQAKDIKPGKHFMPYTEIEFSIVEAVEALEEILNDSSISKRIWIKAFLLNDYSIRLEVAGTLPNCEETRMKIE